MDKEIENPMVRERLILDYFQQMILREFIAENYYKNKNVEKEKKTL